MNIATNSAYLAGLLGQSSLLRIEAGNRRRQNASAGNIGL